MLPLILCFAAERHNIRKNLELQVASESEPVAQPPLITLRLLFHHDPDTTGHFGHQMRLAFQLLKRVLGSPALDVSLLCASFGMLPMQGHLCKHCNSDLVSA
eukprot:324021-Amphidinium_carterae.1